MSKYHVQIVSAGRDADGGYYPIRDPLIQKCKHIVVDAADITDAKAKAEEIILTWDGDWWIDGHPVERGSHIGQAIG